MPIYEYHCASCGHQLEKLQKISAAPLVDCPECGNPALTKKISAAGFRLKGGGWYETDFKTSNKKNIHGDSKSPGGDSGSKTPAAAKGETGKTEPRPQAAKAGQ